MRILAALLLSACATTSSPPKGGPRGLHANEHLDAAHLHDQSARESWQWPDARSSVPGATTIPWVRSWDATAEHERAAAVHRSRAADLHAEYEEACGTRALADIAVSPLERYGIGGWNTSAGVTLYLSPAAGAPDKLLADLKCHRAWMMLSPSGMDECSLDLPGVQLDARGDRDVITISIMIRDPALVTELHRRAAHELEVGARWQAETPH